MSSALTPHKFTKYAVTITFNEPDLGRGLLDLAMRFGLYAAIIALLLMITALVLKLMWNCDQAGGEDTRPTHTSSLLSPKEEGVFNFYGTSSSEGDLESGKGSCSGSSSDDLYDEKICAICYDDQRSCLFDPCGHCITCYTCAHRIINDEFKSTCPICRTIIHKVRKLQIL